MIAEVSHRPIKLTSVNRFLIQGPSPPNSANKTDQIDDSPFSYRRSTAELLIVDSNYCS